MFMITTKDSRNIFFIFLALLMVALYAWPGLSTADDHNDHDSYSKRYEGSKEHFDSGDFKVRQVKKEDKGNEATGQTAAWLLVAGNLTVVLSLLIKGLSRYSLLEPKMQSSINQFNRFQKKYLMRFHYVLNPSALCVVVIHFLLSSCGTTSLPEWGLVVMTVMVFIGLMLKLKTTPKWMWRFIYRLHTGTAAISILIVLLVAGHWILD